MKISGLIFILFIIFTFLPGIGYSRYLCGDVNTDGEVSIIDSLVIAKYVVGIPVTIETSIADVNNDAEITIIDALLISLYTMGLIDTLSCPIPTPEPTIDPTPVTEPDLDGRWYLDPIVNLSLLTSQIIYDHSGEYWSGIVEMTGYINDTIITDVSKRVLYQPPGNSITFTLTTESTVYPYYEIVISFTDHGGLRLMLVRATVEEDELTSIEFSKNYNIPFFNWSDNLITLDTGDMLSEDGSKTLRCAIVLNREKTLAIEEGTLYTLPYKPYDEITSIIINGDDFTSSFIYQGDIVISISGTVEIYNNIITLDYDPTSRFASFVPPPIIFHIITGEADELMLLRDVPDPGETAIINFYGIEPCTIEFYEYKQLFIKKD